MHPSSELPESLTQQISQQIYSIKVCKRALNQIVRSMSESLIDEHNDCQDPEDDIYNFKIDEIKTEMKEKLRTLGAYFQEAMKLVDWKLLQLIRLIQKSGVKARQKQQMYKNQIFGLERQFAQASKREQEISNRLHQSEDKNKKAKFELEKLLETSYAKIAQLEKDIAYLNKKDNSFVPLNSNFQPANQNSSHQRPNIFQRNVIRDENKQQISDIRSKTKSKSKHPDRYQNSSDYGLPEYQTPTSHNLLANLQREDFSYEPSYGSGTNSDYQDHSSMMILGCMPGKKHSLQEPRQEEVNFRNNFWDKYEQFQAKTRKAGLSGQNFKSPVKNYSKLNSNKPNLQDKEHRMEFLFSNLRDSQQQKSTLEVSVRSDEVEQKSVLSAAVVKKYQV